MIIPATLSDAADCSTILNQWIEVNPWYRTRNPNSASIQSMESRIESGTVLLKLHNGKTVGFVAFTDGYLDCLYLSDNAQNIGFGTALLNEAKRESPRKLALWVLQQNHAAQRFYLREGFIETARGDGSDNEENLPDICFEWTTEALNHGEPS